MVWSRSSLCLASSLIEVLTAARSAEVEEDLAEIAACRSYREYVGEDLAVCRTRAALRATAWACLISGLTNCFFWEGGFDKWMVLKDISAALLRAKLVQSRIIDVRLGEAGLFRECWRRGRVEERRDS